MRGAGRGTLERLSDDRWAPPWVRHQHRARFAWAASYARGARVVDVACGVGLGASHCAEAGAAWVVGFDAAPAAVREAVERHGRAGVLFALADARRLPLAAGVADLVVSLETIEHLDDPRAFVAEVARVLRPGGRLLCSTPNRDVTNPGTGPGDPPFNPHHVREFTRPELEALLGEFFPRVECLGQTFFPAASCRRLATIGRSRPGLAVKLHQLRKLSTLSLARRPAERHRPRPLVDGWEPEILIAVGSR